MKRKNKLIKELKLKIVKNNQTKLHKLINLI